MKKLLIFIYLISNCFEVNAQFIGGIGDGFAGSTIFTQPTVSIFAGGSSDGFATTFYNQVGAPLPIKLINFAGKKIGEINQLNWQTSSEINASHFEIERSVDAKAFEKIGEVKAIKSESYEFIDNSSFIIQHSSLFYYRLKLIDLDGKYQYSKIISIDNNSDNEIVGAFYPNPVVEGKTTIDINTLQKEEWTISQFDISGKLLKTEKRVLEKGMNKISIYNANAGLYIFGFQNSKNTFYRKVLK